MITYVALQLQIQKVIWVKFVSEHQLIYAHRAFAVPIKIVEFEVC